MAGERVPGQGEGTERPMPAEPSKLFTFRIFAARDGVAHALDLHRRRGLLRTADHRSDSIRRGPRRDEWREQRCGRFQGRDVAGCVDAYAVGSHGDVAQLYVFCNVLADSGTHQGDRIGPRDTEFELYRTTCFDGVEYARAKRRLGG